MSCGGLCPSGPGSATQEEVPLPVLPRSNEVPGVLGGGVLAAGRLARGVPVPLMTRLALVQGTVTASEALEVGECTAGNVDIVVFAFSSLSSIEVELEIGNDRENWSSAWVTVFTQGGYGRFRFRGVAARFIRLYYRATGSPGGIGILTTTVHGTRL